VEIREMGQPIGRKQLELKRVHCMHSLSSKEFFKFKAFGVEEAKKLWIQNNITGKVKKNNSWQTIS
jgi:hypothetical protein